MSDAAEQKVTIHQVNDFLVECPYLTATQARVAYFLIHRRDKRTNRVYYGKRKVAERIHANKDVVRNAFTLLEKHGWITPVVNEDGKVIKKGRAIEYEVQYEAILRVVSRWKETDEFELNDPESGHLEETAKNLTTLNPVINDPESGQSMTLNPDTMSQFRVAMSLQGPSRNSLVEYPYKICDAVSIETGHRSFGMEEKPNTSVLSERDQVQEDIRKTLLDWRVPKELSRTVGIDNIPYPEYEPTWGISNDEYQQVRHAWYMSHKKFVSRGGGQYE